MNDTTSIQDQFICEVTTSRTGPADVWAKINPVLNVAEFGFESDSNNFKVGDGQTAWNDLPYFLSEEDIGDVTGPPGPPGPDGAEGPQGIAGPSGVMARVTQLVTTPTLANNEQHSGIINLATTYLLLQISTDVPARVRLYRDSASRTADASREPGIAPTGNHGLVIDLVTTSDDLDWFITVPGSSEDVACQYLVDNLQGSSGTVSVTITFVQLED